MGLWPACAGTQTGAPQRLKTPPIRQGLGGAQHTPRIGGRELEGSALEREKGGDIIFDQKFNF